jgi:hypothetical protein
MLARLRSLGGTIAPRKSRKIKNPPPKSGRPSDATAQLFGKTAANAASCYKKRSLFQALGLVNSTVALIR